jgi:hypothetical protein
LAIESTETQLERVQAAIAAIESGSQSYSIGGRAMTKADLKTLYEREKDLKLSLADETYGSTSFVTWARR